jgi:hypothetical protein
MLRWPHIPHRSMHSHFITERVMFPFRIRIPEITAANCLVTVIRVGACIHRKSVQFRSAQSDYYTLCELRYPLVRMSESPALLQAGSGSLTVFCDGALQLSHRTRSQIPTLPEHVLVSPFQGQHQEAHKCCHHP